MGGANSPGGPSSRLIRGFTGAEVHLANCRLIFHPHAVRNTNFLDLRASALSFRNCELNGNLVSVAGWHCESGSRCSIENCVSAVGYIGFHPRNADVKDVAIRVRGNTLVGDGTSLVLRARPNLPDEDEPVPPIHLDLAGNVFGLDSTLALTGAMVLRQANLAEPLSPAEVEAVLPRLLRLDEQRNLYSTDVRMLEMGLITEPLPGARSLKLADWQRLWNQENTGSLEGDIRFAGGNLIERARTAPELLTAADYRLHPDSAGYRAGPDGKDLGADIDLVGPGAAYERWKKTPAYQEWLKETGQVK
jgi:hypothetical protein